MKKLLFLLMLPFAAFAGIDVNGTLVLGTAAQFRNTVLNNPKQLQVSNSQTYSTVVQQQSAQSVSGTLKGIAGSQFLIRQQSGKVEGFIIVSQANDIAYQYVTDANDQVSLVQVSVNKIMCVNYGTDSPMKSSAKTKTQVLGAQEAVPLLQSLPGSSNVAYLDFDGYTLPKNKYWNGNQTVTVSATGFTNQEMTAAFNIIAEDYAPFNINITTDESVFLAAPAASRMRVVFTPSSSWYGAAGGVAYIGSFSWGEDVPCWVFIDRLNYDSEYAGEAAAHELGHTVNLEHDGGSVGSSGAYYMGHGDWAPIMGGSYYKTVTQFSRGEYNGANQQQDDLAEIAAVVGYLSDDVGNTVNTASALVIDNTGVVLANSNKGLINSRTDLDVFTFSTSGGTVSLSILPSAPIRTNVDLEVKLYTSNNSLVQTYGTGHSNIMNGVNISTTLAAGDYYIIVDGVGTGNASTGWSDYNSMGPYTISGNVPNIKNNYDVAAKMVNGITSGGCADSIKPVVQILNNGLLTLTSVEVEILLNNVVVKSFTHQTSLATGATENISIPAIALVTSGTNVVTVRLKNPNNQTDAVLSNNDLDFTFNIGIGNLMTFKISSTSVDLPNISWSIKENNNTVVTSANNAFNTSGAFKTQSFCLVDNKCYDINVSTAFITAICTQYSAWKASTIYNSGDMFSYNGRLYKATTQIWNANPVNFPQYYQDMGACPAPSPTDYFEIVDVQNQQSLLKKTVAQYVSPSSDAFCLGNTTSVQTVAKSQLNIYPNPTSAEVNLNSDEQIVNVKVYSLDGRILLENSANIKQIDLSSFAAGTYLLSVQTANNLYFQKVMRY